MPLSSACFPRITSYTGDAIHRGHNLASSGLAAKNDLEAHMFLLTSES